MYLLDTNTLSELRKRRSGKISAAVEAWAGSVDQADMYLSVITIMEIELGIALLERRDPRQAGMLRLWLHDKVMPAFAGRILSIDTTIALRCARLHVPDTKSERDAWIAATGLVHDLTIVTRNVADFAGTGVTLLDPWTFNVGL
ncbi:type II toxin-antitoxin system VapC family toxin [Sphingomonas faeni]|jgi:predicted nucleic acid-binding protein|uniref:type II toxin-antitoxin system VapC family toxin n=1 Tax=Sphingomonas faeni TaxID=185950 RepID=UPI00278ADD02|nr:type II toxin-antitoxin system VapC family toxin [Sphingomonas faeni]MDQ0840200.1 putative nucleic acid-binding protein [Sphingomonas faeni]